MIVAAFTPCVATAAHSLTLCLWTGAVVLFPLLSVFIVFLFSLYIGMGYSHPVTRNWTDEMEEIVIMS